TVQRHRLGERDRNRRPLQEPQGRLQADLVNLKARSVLRSPGVGIGKYAHHDPARHALVGLLRQSVFGRLAGYEDVHDAERLRHDPAIRWIVGGTAAHSKAASPSHMGRFETQWLAAPANLSALADLSQAVAWQRRG